MDWLWVAEVGVENAKELTGSTSVKEDGDTLVYVLACDNVCVVCEAAELNEGLTRDD